MQVSINYNSKRDLHNIVKYDERKAMVISPNLVMFLIILKVNLTWIINGQYIYIYIISSTQHTVEDFSCKFSCNCEVKSGLIQKYCK